MVSILTVSVAAGLLVLPALSVAVQLRLWMPAPVTDAPYGPEPADRFARPSRQATLATPLRASAGETVSLTGLVLFQPLRPSGVWLMEMVGFVPSILIDT